VVAVPIQDNTVEFGRVKEVALVSVSGEGGQKRRGSAADNSIQRQPLTIWGHLRSI